MNMVLLGYLTPVAPQGVTKPTPLPPERFQYSQVHMGVRVSITLYAADSTRAETAARAAFDRFAELDSALSDYRQDSELMAICRRAGTGPVPVGGDLFEVLSVAQRISEATGGAFDVTGGPVFRLWKEAIRERRAPTQAAIQDARTKVGWRLVELDAEARTVTLKSPGMQIDLGGIAKGYACDEAIESLAANGISRAMVEAGGDIVVSGPPPGKLGWTISVRGLAGRKFLLARCAISTSGDAEQYVQLSGRRYSHIVDPRTGWALDNRIQCTVIAKHGVISDSLATALCVLGPKDGAAVASAFGAEPHFVFPSAIK
ncbi:MAG: FAD:protein FMN transferase [Armatimonadetes bacterium]|nr:FAD:protein FMN transferase [Armatimonadota bacterium]